ncbi:hypothetical protein GOZ83_13660 [Agrobacterium vitis]|uniref:hypothetical protein n=1 Tax=Rhizobium/Agrobacterium group TaxID=227290 RepID=UPI0012E9191F|nr:MULTISPECIES: hypothetical protein [Rhizobium/Agrobacterium group]MCF1491797.1 hypothetical protein [Allorhizobium ampelinum]MVA46108.1 hypothetical protein [Agrobacterium vitis]
MNKEILVSAGVIGASGDISFLTRLPSAHVLQRDGDQRGKQMTERRMGAFVSVHRIGDTDVHVREEYGLGGRHRFYVMTGSERVRGSANFIAFDGLAFE